MPQVSGNDMEMMVMVMMQNTPELLLLIVDFSRIYPISLLNQGFLIQIFFDGFIFWCGVHSNDCSPYTQAC